MGIAQPSYNLASRWRRIHLFSIIIFSVFRPPHSSSMFIHNHLVFESNFIHDHGVMYTCFIHQTLHVFFVELKCGMCTVQYWSMKSSRVTQSTR